MKFDILALVALDCERIAYLEPGNRPGCVIIRDPRDGVKYTRDGKQWGKVFEDYPFEKALASALTERR